MANSQSVTCYNYCGLYAIDECYYELEELANVNLSNISAISWLYTEDVEVVISQSVSAKIGAGFGGFIKAGISTSITTTEGFTSGGGISVSYDFIKNIEKKYTDATFTLMHKKYKFIVMTYKAIFTNVNWFLNAYKVEYDLYNSLAFANTTTVVNIQYAKR